jgi:hypothetical protein
MHRTDNELALYAGGELDRWTRWPVAWHLRRCSICRKLVSEYRAVRGQWKAEADAMPADVAWDRLSAEMTANIRLGLAAGECVGPAPQAHSGQSSVWRPAYVLAGVMVVVGLAWFANSDKPQIPTNMVKAVPSAGESGVRLGITAAGLELRENGHVLTLKHPQDHEVAYGATMQTVRARYVDSETGQVTINKLYVQ